LEGSENALIRGESMKTEKRSPYSLFETISYLYWKIFRFYKRQGYNRLFAGKTAKRVCIRQFGYENYQAWRYRFREGYDSEMRGFEE
jgi:hypothetical protein